MKGPPDGVHPAGLTPFDGALYGTAAYGGTSNAGIIFKLKPPTHESIVYTFAGGKDGEVPGTHLTNLNGELYGVTYSGGIGCPDSTARNGCGTIFRMSLTGKKQTIYDFKGGAKDGSHPDTDLLLIGNALYGATHDGFGKDCSGYGCGVVYEVTPSGKERVLHHFVSKGGAFWPVQVISAKGMIFGILQGPGNRCESKFCGAVFSTSTSGKTRTLYTFRGNTDGATPANLAFSSGTLYGTTFSGGSYCVHYSYGYCGTVFSLTTSGRQRVLYRFQGGDDGENPVGIVVLNGTLYGTTIFGGGTGCNLLGCGTVFSLSETGSEKPIHKFAGGAGGQYPTDIVSANGRLYGTTIAGGDVGASPCGSTGCGTIFEISP